MVQVWVECSKKQTQGTSRGRPCFPASLCTTSIQRPKQPHGLTRSSNNKIVSAADITKARCLPWGYLCCNLHWQADWILLLLVSDHCTQLALFDGLSRHMVWHCPASTYFSCTADITRARFLPWGYLFCLPHSKICCSTFPPSALLFHPAGTYGKTFHITCPAERNGCSLQQFCYWAITTKTHGLPCRLPHI